MKSSFFVPKSRNTYGCEMPALAAMASVDAPSSPCSANSTYAASRTDSRRSSADFLFVVVAMEVSYHSLTSVSSAVRDLDGRVARLRKTGGDAGPATRDAGGRSSPQGRKGEI